MKARYVKICFRRKMGAHEIGLDRIFAAVRVVGCDLFAKPQLSSRVWTKIAQLIDGLWLVHEVGVSFSGYFLYDAGIGEVT